MSRIVAGAAGGMTLSSVPGDATRPTTDRVKEALFSRLESYGVLSGARVLDLYAGTGALGVESASRGAEVVILVERSEKAAAVCAKNAELANSVLGRNAVQVNRSAVSSFLDRLPAERAWDLVFLDPPYPLEEDALAGVLLAVEPRLAAGAVIVVERSSRSPEPLWPAGIRGFADKKYGETRLWYAEPDLP